MLDHRDLRRRPAPGEAAEPEEAEEDRARGSGSYRSARFGQERRICSVAASSRCDHFRPASPLAAAWLLAALARGRRLGRVRRLGVPPPGCASFSQPGRRPGSAIAELGGSPATASATSTRTATAIACEESFGPVQRLRDDRLQPESGSSSTGPSRCHPPPTSPRARRFACLLRQPSLRRRPASAQRSTASSPGPTTGRAHRCRARRSQAPDRARLIWKRRRATIVPRDRYYAAFEEAVPISTLRPPTSAPPSARPKSPCRYRASAANFVADHAAVVDFAHPPLVDQEVGVADHLGEGEEGLGDGDVAPDRLRQLVAGARPLRDQLEDLLLAPLVSWRGGSSIRATWSTTGSPWPGRTISAGISRVLRIDSM